MFHIEAKNVLGVLLGTRVNQLIRHITLSNFIRYASELNNKASEYGINAVFIASAPDLRQAAQESDKFVYSKVFGKEYIGIAEGTSPSSLVDRCCCASNLDISELMLITAINFRLID